MKLPAGGAGRTGRQGNPGMCVLLCSISQILGRERELAALTKQESKGDANGIHIGFKWLVGILIKHVYQSGWLAWDLKLALHSVCPKMDRALGSLSTWSGLGDPAFLPQKSEV